MDIEFNNLSFSYPGTAIGTLKDINLTIKQGECVVLIGPSGCGKTTLTRLINGLIPSFYKGKLSGFCSLLGTNIKDIESYKLSKYVGSVFQNPRTQFFNVDTDSELAFGLENAGVFSKEINERIDAVTKELKIENLRDRDIFKLSGGEKQKIAFASVYATSPDIFVLDEPSANLDKEGIEELRKCLLKVKEEGKTIIIAEHRLYYLKDIMTKAIYLKDGAIEKVFSKDEFISLKEEPLHSMGLRNNRYIEREKTDSKISDNASGLTVKNLSVSMDSSIIFKDVCATFKRGKIYAVVGRNGAGKSTLLRTISGLNKKFEGTISLDGVSLNPSKLREKSFMVMQDVNYQLFADSVANECSLGIKNPDLNKVDMSLSSLGLDSFKERHPNTLSGGQKQRLAIAVSYVLDKDILLFDEPTSGLDYENMLLTSKILKKLSLKNKVIIVVTHDEEFINEACDEVFTLK